jgi:hypothetical protein
VERRIRAGTVELVTGLGRRKPEGRYKRMTPMRMVNALLDAGVPAEDLTATDLPPRVYVAGPNGKKHEYRMFGDQQVAAAMNWWLGNTANRKAQRTRWNAETLARAPVYDATYHELLRGLVPWSAVQVQFPMSTQWVPAPEPRKQRRSTPHAVPEWLQLSRPDGCIREFRLDPDGDAHRALAWYKEVDDGGYGADHGGDAA